MIYNWIVKSNPKDKLPIPDCISMTSNVTDVPDRKVCIRGGSGWWWKLKIEMYFSWVRKIDGGFRNKKFEQKNWKTVHIA